jgi:hypothetical protein
MTNPVELQQAGDERGIPGNRKAGATAMRAKHREMGAIWRAGAVLCRRRVLQKGQLDQ